MMRRVTNSQVIRAALALALLLTSFVWAGSASAAGAVGAVYALANAASGNAVGLIAR